MTSERQSERRELKKAKMDDQPSTVQSDTADIFLANETYTTLLELVPKIDGYCYVPPVCLLGPKGVGKSATLKALHKALGPDKSTFMDLESEKDPAEKIKRAEAKTSRHIMLVDNIHLASKHEWTVLFVRKHVKQMNTDLNVYLISAVSGDGVKAMMDDKDLRLTSHNFHIIVMDPEPDIGRRLLEDVSQNIPKLKELMMNEDNTEKIHKVLDSFGWLAGEVIRLSGSFMFTGCDVDVLLQRFTRDRILELGRVLQRDLESRGGDNYCTQVLAWCLSGGIRLDNLEVRKEELPWTLLKYEDPNILAVSEMAKKSILHVLVGNVAKATDVIKVVEELGLPTGQIRGDYFEMAVFKYITTFGRVKFEYTSCAETRAVELISSQLKIATLNGTDVPEINEDVNACYHAPHMKGGDIILVYGNNVYFIQCSVATYDNVLKKKGFMDVAKPGWIAILITPYDLRKDLLTQTKSQLSQDYMANKFSIACALKFLPDQVIETVYP